MARDILSEYGPDSHESKVGTGSSGLAHGGGKPTVKPINYKEPKGPEGINHEGVGLGGDSCHCGSQGKH